MKNELEAIVLDLVNDRVSKIHNSTIKIDAFVSVKTWRGIPDSLRNVFLTKAMEAVGTILSQEAVSRNVCYYYMLTLRYTLIDRKLL